MMFDIILEKRMGEQLHNTGTKSLLGSYLFTALGQTSE